MSANVVLGQEVQRLNQVVRSQDQKIAAMKSRLDVMAKTVVRVQQQGGELVKAFNEANESLTKLAKAIQEEKAARESTRSGLAMRTPEGGES